MNGPRDFARARAMFAAIAAAMALPDSISRKLALDGIGPYVSRGKSRGKGFIKSCLSARSNRDTNKYLPHQGKQECARRIRQGVAHV